MKTIVKLNSAAITALAVAMTFLLTLLFLTKADAVAKLDEKENEQTIIGTVVPAETNDADEVTAVAIQVVTQVENLEDEEGALQEVTEDYLVGDTEKASELMALIGHQVEATGIVETDEEGKKTILVRVFSKTEPDEEKEEGSEKN